MSKSIPSALLTHYASGCTTLAYGLRIQRTDGQVFAFTSSAFDAPVAGTLYLAAQGLDVGGIATSVGFNVDSLELTTLDDGSLFTPADIRDRRWQGAAFAIIRYNWQQPSDGAETLLTGMLGNITLKLGMIAIELRGLQQYLQQPVGSVTSRTCRARFCDAPQPVGNNRCRLSAAAYTDSLTITVVGDARHFTAGATSRADDWFAEGLVTFTSGAAAGITVKVKAFASKQFELLVPLQHFLAIGDTFTALAGCRKRFEEDCRDKFGNAVNFAGEPHVPGLDKLTTTPATTT